MRVSRDLRSVKRRPCATGGRSKRRIARTRVRLDSREVSRFRRYLNPILAVVIVGCAGFFFFRTFQRNWATVKAHDFRLAPAFLVGATLSLALATLLATLSWYTAVNALSRGKITFRQSVAAVNASGFTKYIPGKIWSYALQMYWLDRLGISKALVVYVNLVNLLISMGTTVMFGLLCLLFSHSIFPVRVVLGSLLGLLAVDACSVLFNHAILNGLITLINRVLKRQFAFFQVEKALLVKLHVIQLAAAVASGLSAYLFCFGIGYRIDLDRTLVVVGSSALADVAGFLAIMVPGGLGVREALMYEMLGGAAKGSLALVLPVASRLMSMFVDVVLGLVALRLLKSLTGVKADLGAAKPGEA
jgi:glycosyltransferase 2 family protein